MERYLYDVNRNYDEIIAELSLISFGEIIRQYEEKIAHHSRTMEKISHRNDNMVSVYIPEQ